MREQRDYSPWTIDLREASDEDLLRLVFDISDELSCVHRRTGELVLRLDHIGSEIGERWAPDVFRKIEERERAELEERSGR